MCARTYCNVVTAYRTMMMRTISKAHG